MLINQPFPAPTNPPGTWMSGQCPIPSQEISVPTYLILETTGDQIIHVFSPEQGLELGKMYQGTAL